MKKIERLITSRRVNQDLCMGLIYEWEDEISKNLQIPFYYDRVFRGKNKLIKVAEIFPHLSFLLQTTKLAFMFEMSDYRHNNLNNRKNIIPCIIDFYVDDCFLDYFIRMHSNNQIVIVSSRQAFDFLKDKDLPFQIQHLPLSLPSRYRISPKTQFVKKYDLLIIGRPNPVLLSYVERYALEHIDFVYIYRSYVEGHFCYYTNRGDCLGNKDSREDYFSLLREAKVCLYSTSGMDNDKSLTNGFHQVTPRFLEMIASGCHIISRYEHNSDTEFYEMEKYWPTVDTYDRFCSQLDSFLITPVNMEFYSKYMEKHYTSVRIKQLVNAMKEL